MAFFSHVDRVRRQTEKRLETYTGTPNSFFILIALASAIATIGLILNNTAIVIGAMVVAPLVTPVFGFSLSLIAVHIQQGFKAALMLSLGSIVAIIMAAILTRLVAFIEGDAISITNEIVLRTDVNILYLLVAFFSGVAGAYAYVKPDILASIAGIAISVAVMPPLAVAGIGLGLGDWSLVTNSLLLFAINLAGISFGSIITFLSFGFGATDA
ncbi:MAG: TIGR00341 family protein [Candidatus Magasanikbacteria bacterium CG10_big_fil_rev_8_21_14_0_10_43_6]|uniref:TIGR00341 family protein n=1 Tax=Candidatus Magasanikbacteria bacterium CG10_big_fil_rev_8_21_14_0_10_43_6 TaxID=1974650 RepID=A0A2M6W2G1_9BACT|nr:MAG: TIGR00341 family protein [Candidatus Magasanikbacteria bacterium CG10_big_fil_rev_8_21_14_0_10_43_6]